MQITKLLQIETCIQAAEQICSCIEESLSRKKGRKPQSTQAALDFWNAVIFHLESSRPQAVNAESDETLPWVELTGDNIPTGKVLAASFKKDSSCYNEKIVGYISTHPVDGPFVEAADTILFDVTHFINLSLYDL